MRNGDLIILRGREVSEILDGRELELMAVVRKAYEAHAGGDSSLPHSTFLRFPADQQNRIIALPAYLGEGFGVAGIKWVSSFPGNVRQQLDRASAVVILNSPHTGRPEALIEGSIISAKRTAASVALAAQSLTGGGLNGHAPRAVGFIGCGLINFEIARFLLTAFPGVEHFIAYDLDEERAHQFGRKCRGALGGIEVEVARDLRSVLKRAPLVSLATTATTPHISDLKDCAPAATVLHVSLRDLTPEAILACDNVVDDVDHVCRAGTSVNLAEQLTGDRSFIRCTLADILLQKVPARRDDGSIAVFSPFGLGVLDLAVAKLVLDRGLEQKLGTVLPSFLPDSWVERS
jgi:ornithine cyclodeaminase